MKKFIASFGIILIALTYGFIVIIPHSNAINSTFTDKPDIVKETYCPTVLTNLFYNTSESESIVSSFNNTQLNTFEDTFKKSLVIAKITEQFFLNEFTQYISNSRNFLIKFRKNDIIFPSHYFW